MAIRWQTYMEIKKDNLNNIFNIKKSKTICSCTSNINDITASTIWRFCQQAEEPNTQRQEKNYNCSKRQYCPVDGNSIQETRQ